jgi:hypothetical protein
MEKENFNLKNNNNDISFNYFNKECSILQMLSIPYLGVYSDDYTFMSPTLNIKLQTPPKNLPKTIKNKLKKLPLNLEPSFFHITLDGSNLYKNYNQRIINDKFARINVIPHPYIFYNVNLIKGREHVTHVYASIYTRKQNNYEDFIKESNEGDNVRINPECDFLDKSLKREIILHLSDDGFPAISPNNLSILLNLNCQIISFYLIIVGTYKNSPCKFCVVEFLIFPNFYQNEIFKDLYKSFVKNNDNTQDILLNCSLTYLIYSNIFKKVFFYFFDEIIQCKNADSYKELYKTIFTTIFDYENYELDKEQQMKDLINIGNFYFENLISFVEFLFEDKEHKIKNYGYEILSNCFEKEYILEIIIKYINFHIKYIFDIFFSFNYYLNDYENFNEEIIEEISQSMFNEKWNKIEDKICKQLNVEKEIFEKKVNNIEIKLRNKNRKTIPNRNIEIFKKILNELLEKNNLNESLVNELDVPIQNFLFYNVWEMKGCLMGIHNDFGKYSFLRKIIPSCYHCDNEEIFKICEEMCEILEKIDQSYKTID